MRRWRERQRLLRAVALWRAEPATALAWPIAGLAALTVATAGQAQVAGSIALASDDMFRGYSVSNGDPALSLGVSAEFEHGIYGGVTLATAFGGTPSPVVNGSNQYIGVAHRMASGVSVDAGIVHRYYTRYATNDYADDFVEAYVGVAIPNLGLRLYLSPNYGGPGAPAGYFEVNATPYRRDKWAVALHVGAMLPPSTPGPDHATLVLIDWQVGVTRSIGAVAATVAWVGQGKTIDDPQIAQKLVASLGMAF